MAKPSPLLTHSISGHLLTIKPHRETATPEGRCQPTKESGDCSDCSSGCVAARPGTDSAQDSLLDLLHGEVYSDLIKPEEQFLWILRKSIAHSIRDNWERRRGKDSPLWDDRLQI